MTEYYFPRLDYYFMTSRDSDKAALDSQFDWQRTGKSFEVFADDAVALSAISRFYFDRVAKQKARGSHFYTLLDSDRNALRSLNPRNQALFGKPFDEGLDSYAFFPTKAGVDGTCASGQVPFYRLFRGNAHFPDDPNNRFTTDVAIYNNFVAQGWDGEGVAFCVPR